MTADILSSRWRVYDTEGRQARMVQTEGGVFVLDAVSPDVAVAIADLHNAGLDPLRRTDALLADARQCADEGAEGHALRRYRKLDELLAAGAELPEAWSKR